MSLQPDDTPILFDRVTLGVFLLLGVTVALAEWELLPDATRLLGVPALAAAMLLDTFLYNEFLLRTGRWVWLEIYAFLYVEAVVVGAAARVLRPYLPGRAAVEP